MDTSAGPRRSLSCTSSGGKLPASYRFNQQLQRYEEIYLNYDCSVDGFEGIRSQDILPLLLQNFHFDVFVAFANVIDPLSTALSAITSTPRRRGIAALSTPCTSATSRNSPPAASSPLISWLS